MNKNLISFFLFLGFTFYFSMHIKAQNGEFGGGIGAFNYTGDLNPKYNLLNHRPAFQAYYKHHLSNAITFRVSATAGFLTGGRRPSGSFLTSRDSALNAASISPQFKVFLFEASTGFEYQFLDWRSDNPLIFGTPYIYMGMAIFGISGQAPSANSYSTIQPAIPIGVGLKYIINPNWYVSMEFGARFLFFDYIDNTSDGDLRYKNYDYGNWFNNDLYYHLGFTVTYSFYKIPCPTNPYR